MDKELLQNMHVVMHDIFTQVSSQWEQVVEVMGGLTSTEVMQFKERSVSEDEHFIGYTALQQCYSRLEEDVITRLRDALSHIKRDDLADLVLRCHQKPLIIACCNGVLSELKRLHDLGLTLNYSDLEHGTPLQIAVRKRDKEMVLYILNDPEPCDPNMADSKGMTALQIACKRGSHSMIKLILKANGINVNAEHSEYGSSLFIACERGDLDAASELLEAGADATTLHQGASLLHVAASLMNLEIAKAVIGLDGIDIDRLDQNDKSALTIASQKCDEAMATLLLANKADPLQGKDRFTSLHHAAANNALPVFRLLLHATKGNLPMTDDEKSVLDIAQEKKSTDIIVYLLCNAFFILGEPGSSPLHWACAQGDEDVVFRMISSQLVNLEHQDKYGSTALHLASDQGSLTNVQKLLNSGADAWVFDNNKETPLHKACSKGHLDVAELLLNSGTDVNVACLSYATPLHRACANDNFDIVQLLLRWGADQTRKDNLGRTAVDISTNVNILNILEGTALSASGKPIAKVQDNVKKSQISDGIKDIHRRITAAVKPMMPKHILGAFMGRDPLHEAAERGDSSVVRYRVDRKAKVNQHDLNGDTPLHLAAANGHAGVCEILVNDGKAAVDAVNLRGMTALALASLRGWHSVVKDLLDYGANATITDKDENMTPLQMAVEAGHDGVVDVLLNYKGALRLNHKTIVGDAALHIAAKAGHAKICKALIDKGSSTHGKIAEGNKKRKPLHYAAEYGREHVALVLLEGGANPNSKDEEGMMPLHMAVTKGFERIVKFLLKRGADVNAELPYKGGTALHIAAKAGHLNIVEKLLQHGAKTNIKNAKGKVAEKVASSDEVKRLIKDHEKRKRNAGKPSFGRSATDTDLNTALKESATFFTGLSLDSNELPSEGNTSDESASEYSGHKL